MNELNMETGIIHTTAKGISTKKTLYAPVQFVWAVWTKPELFETVVNVFKADKGLKQIIP